jgi:hypothetical protein
VVLDAGPILPDLWVASDAVPILLGRSAALDAGLIPPDLWVVSDAVPILLDRLVESAGVAMVPAYSASKGWLTDKSVPDSMEKQICSNVEKGISRM